LQLIDPIIVFIGNFNNNIHNYYKQFKKDYECICKKICFPEKSNCNKNKWLFHNLFEIAESENAIINEIYRNEKILKNTQFPRIFKFSLCLNQIRNRSDDNKCRYCFRLIIKDNKCLICGDTSG